MYIYIIIIQLSCVLYACIMHQFRHAIGDENTLKSLCKQVSQSDRHCASDNSPFSLVATNSISHGLGIVRSNILMMSYGLAIL